MRVPEAARSRRRRALAGSLAILVLALSGSLVAACGGGDHATAMPTLEAGAPMTATPAPAADAAALEAAWAARPDYVRHAHPMVEEAYRYALERPDVIQWMPCYCGCAAMEHRSNLDCFFRSRMAGGAVGFEEHASYCDICVETANMASGMLQQGKTMIQIRAAVDSTYGGGAAPGMDTPLPPS